ncbi:hypothetical protein TGVAND_219440 [Toxoplasma gondii VAND]|uniref:Cleavage and polyadenylation specificity factor subunit 2 n=1 Tax=Toxoplasma gondii VAND TaxID=933077 RepID=A0A086PXL0_TOXGO|nr:hypothetical protein TGVAND_219440 [Toxoplasma gondii VAND]
MVRVAVEPLYVGGRGSGGFHAAILRLGRFSLLMNCGATDLLDPHDIDLLLPYLNEIDGIFISHGSLRHLGGLPLLHSRQKAVSVSGSSSLDSPFHLCCCFSAACRACSVPAFLTQASQRLGKVALEGAVLSNAQSRGVRASAPARGVHTPPEPGEAAGPGTPGEEEGRGEGQRGEAVAKTEESEGREGSLGVEEGFAEAAVSTKDISAIMEACRVLRYEERIRLFPRRRREEQRDDEVGEAAENEDAEARGEACDFRLDRAHSDADDEPDQEEDDTEVYVHCIQAGHALGGAVWLFDADGRKVVFAVDHSLNPLWHTDGSALLSLLPSLRAAPSTPSPSPSFSSPSRDSFSPPCLFISDVHEPPTGLHSWRVPALRGFFLQIAHVLQRGGDVIIPLDIGSPLLELLLHLEALWRLAPSLHGFPIFLLSPVSASFLLACRPLLPQSTQRARALFASQRVNPLFTNASASLSSLLAHRLAAPPLPEATRDSPWLARKQTRKASLQTILPFSPGSNLLDRLPETGSLVTSAVGADGLPARVWGKDGDSRGNVAGGPGSVSLPAPDWSPTSGVSTPPPGSRPAGGEDGAQRPSGTEGARRPEEVHAEAALADWAGGRTAGFLGAPGLASPAGVFGGARAPQGTAGTGPWSASCGLPFGNLKFVKLLSTEREVEHLLQQREQEREKNNTEPRRSGCVFVCTPASLDSGFGRCLLIREAEEEANAIFFLSEPWPGTTAHRVWSAQKDRVASACSTQMSRREDSSFSGNDREESSSPELVLTQTRRVALSPEELLRLFEREKEKRAAELEKKRHSGAVNEAKEEPGEPAKEEQTEAFEEEKGPLLLHEGDDRDLVDYDDDLVENLEDIEAAPSLFPFAGFALPQDDSFYAQTEELAGDAQDQGEEPAEETAAEACGADEGPALGASSRGLTDGVESDGDNPLLDTCGPCMQGDRDEFAQPPLSFACASLGGEAARDRVAPSRRQVKEASEASRRVGGFEGDAKKEKEEEEDFGVAVSAEQKAVWTAATLSVGTAAASGAPVSPFEAFGAPVPGDSKLLWAGGGVWPGSDRVAVASAFALPPAGLFAGGAEAYRHLVEGEKRIAGAPRRRHEKLKAELLLAKRGGHVASPWLGVPSSLAFSAFGVASSPCPAGLVGAPSGLLPGMRPTAGDAYRLQEAALPAWRRQLRQWVGGEDPTGVESLTVKVSLRCHVECISGGLEGVTSLQGLVNFLSLLRPQNVFLLPSSTGPLTRELVRSLSQAEELQTDRLGSIPASEGENGDAQSSHLDESPVQNSEEAEMTDAEPRPDEASPLQTSELLSSKAVPSLTQDSQNFTESRPGRGPAGGATVCVSAKEALQVGLGHRLVASLLASLGPHARVQLLVSRASSAALSPSVSRDAPRFSHVGLLDLPSGQAVLRLDRRLWAELQAHAVPVPAPRAARGALESRQTPGADQERPNWGQRLCFVARARGAVQLLGSEEREGEGEETGPEAETAVEARIEPGRKRLHSGSGPKARRRRFGRMGPSGSAFQSGSFWCPSLRPSFRLVSCDDPTLEETGQAREGASQREETHGAQENASGSGGSCPGASAASASREHMAFSEDKGLDDKRATLLLGRLQLGDVAQHLWSHLGREGGGRGDEADSREAEREEREAKSEIAFAPQGQVLSLANCAAIRILQDGHGSRASVWEVESSVHPWFFYLRRLFASQPFALTGS